MEKINLILKKVLEKIEPPKEDLEEIQLRLKKFKVKFNKELVKHKINATIFEGGSLAKRTLIRKDSYDADIFIRFSKEYKNQDISKITKKLLKNFDYVSIIHGSRDYFRIKESSKFFIELIPVLKVTRPQVAENITDLSYSHVQYIAKKIKSKKILDDIKIAKAFCYFNNIYGAESYIKGFSGYALELLIYHYKSFLKFLKSVTSHKNGKIIIDIEKNYGRKKNKVLFDMNSSKLNSPIILVDPTFKQRNVLAALSEKTFKKFIKIGKKFLKNPSMKYFEKKKTNLIKIKKNALKKNQEFILLESTTIKQSGDVAGTKLLKFYNHLHQEISKFFYIKKEMFDYNQKKSANYLFVVKKKDEIISPGPFITDKKNVKIFKKSHKKIFLEGKKIYGKRKIKDNVHEFVRKWKSKYQKKIKDMGITSLKIIQ